MDSGDGQEHFIRPKHELDEEEIAMQAEMQETCILCAF